MLWYYATFGATGGPPTLSLKAGGRELLHGLAPSTTPASRRRPPVPRCRSGGRKFKASRERPRVRRQARRARAGVCRRRRPVERGEVSPRALLVGCLAPLLVALALAGCGGAGPTAADGTAQLWVTRDRGSEVIVDTDVPAGQTLLRALKSQVEGVDALRRRLRAVDRGSRGQRAAPSRTGSGSSTASPATARQPPTASATATSPGGTTATGRATRTRSRSSPAHSPSRSCTATTASRGPRRCAMRPGLRADAEQVAKDARRGRRRAGRHRRALGRQPVRARDRNAAPDRGDALAGQRARRAPCASRSRDRSQQLLDGAFAHRFSSP